MSRRPPQTFADYLVVGISPALIMFLVGSLIFFLVEVFYHGYYPGRLLFVMAMFVMAAVCISRIAMEEGAAYAALFAIPLAIVVGIALVTFVQIEGPLAPLSAVINLGLMGLIWWCSYKLTWDCTLIDDSQDSSGEGLLQSMGWDRVEGEVTAPPTRGLGRAYEEQPAAAEPQLEAVSTGSFVSNEAQAINWFRGLILPDKRPHAPGRWVVYFSVAALPLFGLGQWFIPVDELASRRFAFWMLVIYVASGLGLLLTTSFLGLRRYLRQRRLEMPVEMAATWMGVGTVMILALLLVVYLLPSPSPEYSLSQIDWIKSLNRNASNYATSGEGGKGKSQSSASVQKGQTPEQSASPSSPNQPVQKGPGGTQPGSQSSNQGQSQSSGGDSQKGAPGEKGNDPGASSKGNPSDKSQGPKGSTQNQPSSQQQPGQQSSGASRPSGSSPEPNQQPPANSTSSSNQSPSASSPPQSSFQPSQLLPKLSSGLGTILKWLFYLTILVVAIVLAWIYRQQVIAAWNKFIQEMRELWARWFGGATPAPASAAVLAAAPPRPFSSFADPFASGMASRATLTELVRYSFDALEAWGREHNSPRTPGQTPLEYAHQLGEVNQSVAREARQLADAYGQLAFAKQAPAAGLPLLRQFWQRLSGASPVRSS